MEFYTNDHVVTGDFVLMGNLNQVFLFLGLFLVCVVSLISLCKRFCYGFSGLDPGQIQSANLKTSRLMAASHTLPRLFLPVSDKNGSHNFTLDFSQQPGLG